MVKLSEKQENTCSSGSISPLDVGWGKFPPYILIYLIKGNDMGHWVGECKRCGKCCIFDCHWLGFDDESEKEMTIEWATARGYKIIQANDKVVQAQFRRECIQLELDCNDHHYSCKLEKIGKKPKQCRIWPMYYTSIMEGLDISKIVPEGCGYKWVEQ